MWFIWFGNGFMVLDLYFHRVAPNLLIQNEIKIKNTNINILYPFEEWPFQLHNFIQSFCIVFFALIFFDKSIL